MKRNVLFSLFLLIVLSPITWGQQAVTVEKIWKEYAFSPSYMSGFKNMNDGKSYCKPVYNKGSLSQIIRYSYETGDSVEALFDLSTVKGGDWPRFTGFSWSSDESKLLLESNVNSIYRHSYTAQIHVWNSEDNTIIPITDHPILHATFSPDASKVGYVFNNDLYYFDLNQDQEFRITLDGKEDHIINGDVDWVYEEEFSMSSGFAWNSSSTQLAYYKFDERKVKEWDMKLYGELYPEHDRFKYPKAGEDNSKVEIHVYHIESKKNLPLALGSENDQYLPRLHWTKETNTLFVQRLNRLQNLWELLSVNSATGEVSTIVKEESKAYIDIQDEIHFTQDGNYFFLLSEKTGYRHIYLHKIDGSLKKQITSGMWEVRELLGIDEASSNVFYSSAQINPVENHVFSIGFNGKKQKQLTEKSGWHNASFSGDCSYYMHSYSNINTPPVYTMKNENGEVLRVLENNESLNKTLKDHQFTNAKFGRVKSADKTTDLNYWMIYPQDFDASKTYPLLMYVYGGPGSQTVENSWGGANRAWYQMLANELGVIVASVDNRGTGGRGAAFRQSTYKNLGEKETADQIAAAHQFANFPYVNKERIGIWGWSYGGYMSTLCLEKGNDIFKMAIAVAPVTHWALYDNVYTERYMQRPQENATGYDANAPVNFADQIKGKYLLVHGTADDNVHVENTMNLVDEMIKNDVDYELLIYPNKNHGIYGGNTRNHLYRQMTRFIEENL